MAEYIKKESLLELETIMVDPEGFEHSCVLSVDVRSAPAADVVEVKHGRWIEDGYIGEPCVCSYCGEPCKDTVMGKPRWNYCPNCGCRMDKDGE